MIPRCLEFEDFMSTSSYPSQNSQLFPTFDLSLLPTSNQSDDVFFSEKHSSSLFSENCLPSSIQPLPLLPPMDLTQGYFDHLLEIPSQTPHLPSLDILSSALLINDIEYHEENSFNYFTNQDFPHLTCLDEYDINCETCFDDIPTEETCQQPETNNLLIMCTLPIKQSGKQRKNQNLGPHTCCINCGTNMTSVWRRAKDAVGSPICNSCGLYEKLHNSRRPIDMRKDSVLRRQSKNPAQRRKRIKNENKAIFPSTKHLKLDHSY